MNNEDFIEVLESRRAILKEWITMDKNCYNDPFLSQHSRGRVAIEEKWLEETEKFLELIRKDRGQ